MMGTRNAHLVSDESWPFASWSSSEKEESLANSKLWKFCQKIIPLSSKLHGNKFFVIEHKKHKATPLLFALVLIEFSDIIFAVDSLPAIFSITMNPFIIYTSNILAILGLRSLYFVLARAIEKIKYLKAMCFNKIWVKC